MSFIKMIILLSMALIVTLLLGQSQPFQDHKKILKHYFSGFDAVDGKREVQEIQKSTAKKKMTLKQYISYKKDKRDFIITKHHLTVSSYGLKHPDNKDYNLKKISYSIDSSGSNKKYSAINVFDEDLKTAWVENDSGYGAGEWIRLKINNEYKYNKGNYTTYGDIIIFPGYGKSTEFFYQNNRLKSALLFVATTDSTYTDEDESGKIKEIKKVVHSKRLIFEDEPKYHLFSLPEYPDLEGTQFIFMLFIEDVYKGSKYNDTCISEIQLVW